MNHLYAARKLSFSLRGFLSTSVKPGRDKTKVRLARCLGQVSRRGCLSDANLHLHEPVAIPNVLFPGSLSLLDLYCLDVPDVSGAILSSASGKAYSFCMPWGKVLALGRLPCSHPLLSMRTLFFYTALHSTLFWPWQEPVLSIVITCCVFLVCILSSLREESNGTCPLVNCQDPASAWPLAVDTQYSLTEQVNACLTVWRDMFRLSRKCSKSRQSLIKSREGTTRFP